MQKASHTLRETELEKRQRCVDDTEVGGWSTASSRAGHKRFWPSRPPFPCAKYWPMCRTPARCEDGVGSACGTCDAQSATTRDRHDPPPARPSPHVDLAFCGRPCHHVPELVAAVCGLARVQDGGALSSSGRVTRHCLAARRFPAVERV